MINIPKSWDEISLSQYLELSQLKHTDFESEIDYNLEKLAILTNTSVDDDYWQNLDYLEMTKIINSINFIYTSPTQAKLKDKVGKYNFYGFENLTLGQFIDCEHFFSDLPAFIAILYRQKKQDEFGNDIWEDFNRIDINKRKYDFYDEPMSGFFDLIGKYAKFKTNFNETYAGLMTQANDEDEKFEEEFLKDNPQFAEAIVEDKKDIKNETKWGWERLLFYLANSDITKIDKILDLPLFFVFNMLAMKKELDIQ